MNFLFKPPLRYQGLEPACSSFSALHFRAKNKAALG